MIMNCVVADQRSCILIHSVVYIYFREEGGGKSEGQGEEDEGERREGRERKLTLDSGVAYEGSARLSS